MRELQNLLRQFLAREIDVEELQRRFAMQLAENPELSTSAAAWLDAGERDGRLSDKVCVALKNVLVSHLAASANGPDSRPTDLFEESLRPGATVSGHIPVENIPRVAAPGSTVIRDVNATVLGSVDDAAASPRAVTIDAQSSVDPVAANLRVGSVLDDQFVLLTQLGHGGMGSVFKARDKLREEAQDRNPYIAVKILSKEFKAHPDSMIALQREARRAQTLAHPNVITVHEFRRYGPHVYITMEYLEGSPLDALLKDEYSNGLPMETAWPIIEGVGKALQYAHEKNIVHSDVKPGNIFLLEDGSVKVLDFGISRSMPISNLPDAEQTRFDAGKRLGGLTPGYASLEMWSQDPPDPRDDIYALACVSYLLLTGRHPFDGHSAKKVMEEKLAPRRIDALSRGQWTALLKGLEVLQKDRTRTVNKFLEDLGPASVRRTRRRIVVLLVVLGAAVLAAVGVHFYGESVEGRALDDLVSMEGERAGAMGERPVLTAEQQDNVDNWLQLAEDYKSDISVNSNPADLAYVLSDGPNSVVQLLDSVLEIDPWHEEARAMKRQVVQVYKRKAEQLFERRKLSDAVLMVRLAEAQNRNSRVRAELLRLERTICQTDPAACRQR